MCGLFAKRGLFVCVGCLSRGVCLCVCRVFVKRDLCVFCLCVCRVLVKRGLFVCVESVCQF